MRYLLYVTTMTFEPLLIVFLRAGAIFQSILRLLLIKAEFLSLDIFNFLHGIYLVKPSVSLRAFRDVVI